MPIICISLQVDNYASTLSLRLLFYKLDAFSVPIQQFQSTNAPQLLLSLFLVIINLELDRADQMSRQTA